MRVIAIERGDRPDLMTKARVIAPQAAVFLAKQLEDHVFADLANIVIDWDGDYAWTGEGEMPADLRVPAMIVKVQKYYPKLSKWLTVDYNLDLEDFFGQDNATKDDLFEVIENLQAKVREEEQRTNAN